MRRVVLKERPHHADLTSGGPDLRPGARAMALEAVDEDFAPVPPEPATTDAAHTTSAPAAANWKVAWPAGLVRSMTSATEAVAAALVELGWDRTDG